MKETTNNTIGFVFLHGAGLGAWIWDDLIKKIKYPSLPVDLPGRGKHISIATKGLSLENYVQSVLSDIDQFGPKKLIIVAHSISGIIGLEIVRLLQNRICGFIAVSASVPSANNSYISSLPLFMSIFLRIMITLAGTRPPVSAIRSGLCEDLNEEQTLEIVNRFVPESKKLYTDKLKSQSVPANSMYIRLKKDKALNESIQNRMIANLNEKQIADIDSGHLPMFSKPDELAQILNTFAVEANNSEQ
ncbi:MAG: alpha/beta hydrolase [Desulfobacterales bacterium]|nr:alpha/beta hydrolase [Desulfobacterales bacterium]